MLVKVLQIQSQLGKKLSLEERLMIFKQKPDFICFPEYALVGENDPDFARSALSARENLNYFSGLSESLSACIIGGSVVEAESDSLFNSAYLFDNGRIAGRYRKLNPVSGEVAKGILPGDKIFTTEIDSVKLGILICADALNTQLFTRIARHNPDLIFIPTTSPAKPDERKIEKFRRDQEIYVRAAQEASCYIVKTCAVGSLFGKPLQGRSLVAAPWGILKRVEPHAESYPCMLSTILDIDEVRDFRRKKKMVSK